MYEKVKEANINSTGGFINQYGNQYIIKGSGRAYSVEHLQEAVLKQVNGQTIKIKDVATVQICSADKIGDGSLNASPAVILTISKQPYVNTLELTALLDEAIIDLQKTLPENVEIKSHIFRQASFIEASINNLNQTLLEGAFFCDIDTLYIFNELAYNHHFFIGYSNFLISVHYSFKTNGLHYQHDEFRRYGNSHWCFGG